MNPTEIFVYGTLKRGGVHHGRLAGQVYVGETATKAEYRLYSLDGYPGMVPAENAAGGRSIRGEIWRVDAACLARLDAFEGVAEALYRRAAARLEPPHDRPGIETYLYLRSTQGRAEIRGWPATADAPRV
jgi:gamma-glutamylaminecyclotransferase